MYQDLERLQELREKGVISEEEFQREKARVLEDIEAKRNAQQPMGLEKPLWGMDENTFCTIMHLSQFAGVILPVLGFVLPIVMWQVGKDGNANVDKHGRMILNWMISFAIYMFIAGILVFVAVGVPILIVLMILNLIFVIKATIKANEGKFWAYPMTLKIF